MEKAAIKKLKLKIFLVFVSAFLFMAGILMSTAGTFKYWQGWLFITVMLSFSFFMIMYFLKKSPEFLERRMNFKEKEVTQKTIINIAAILFFFGFLIPGFDYRFGWSNVPFWLVIGSNLTIIAGFYLAFLAFKENPYAARTVEIFKGQQVIETGPYAIVRHPMYAGVIPMYFFMSLALGSYWALIPFGLTCIIVIVRALDEEKFLKKNLPGYTEYCKKVRYHIIPFVW